MRRTMMRGLVPHELGPHGDHGTTRRAVAVQRAARRVTWFLLWLCSAAVAAAGVHGVQTAIIRGLEAEAIEPKAAGAETPSQFGVAFRDLRLPVGDHVVHGRFVAASRADAPAVLIFHGNGEAVSDWSSVQARLHAAGVASLVFDYSGFGLSSGTPSVEHMHDDAVAAYRTLVRLTPSAESRVLIGHSLGNAVMLDVAAGLQPAPRGLVVHAGFTSAREMAVHTGLVSELVARLLPDLWDNEQALAAGGPPTLVMHGERDEVIPPAMGRRLASVAGARSQFMALDGVGHDDFYIHPSGQEWEPVLRFVASLGTAHPPAAIGL